MSAPLQHASSDCLATLTSDRLAPLRTSAGPHTEHARQPAEASGEGTRATSARCRASEQPLQRLHYVRGQVLSMNPGSREELGKLGGWEGGRRGSGDGREWPVVGSQSAEGLASTRRYVKEQRRPVPGRRRDEAARGHPRSTRNSVGVAPQPYQLSSHTM
jgi:hypothetical protein